MPKSAETAATIIDRMFDGTLSVTEASLRLQCLFTEAELSVANRRHSRRMQPTRPD